MARPSDSAVDLPLRMLAETTRIVRGMSDTALCHAWRHSCWTVQTETSVGGRLAAALLRERLLDELERRDPAGVRAWLETSPRPSEGPERYLGPSGIRPEAERRAPWDPE